jgi:hypothetical protein
MFQRVELTTGFPQAWLRLRLLLPAWGGAAILSSAAAWPWMMVALLALLLVDRLVARGLRQRQHSTRATLGLDGVLRLQRGGREHLATWTGHAWVCRWFCAVDWVSLTEPRRGQALVFAAHNHPDDFRRLRVLLRLGQGRATP